MHTELNAIIANERIAERIAEARRWSLLPKQARPGRNGRRLLTPVVIPRQGTPRPA